MGQVDDTTCPGLVHKFLTDLNITKLIKIKNTFSAQTLSEELMCNAVAYSKYIDIFTLLT